MEFSPEWHALNREAALSSGQIAQGVTALGRASAAEKTYYTQAFFGLSIGIERLAKLIIVSDYAISSSGKCPKDDLLVKIGHDITKLMEKCIMIASADYLKGRRLGKFPTSEIHKGIVSTLTEFAKVSRYYNLDFVLASEKARKAPEPISAWWQRVAEPILDKHYSKRLRQRDSEKADMMEALMGGYSIVVHHDEQEERINSINKLSNHGSANTIVQKYGRLYTLQIIRWLYLLITELSIFGAYEKKIDFLFGLDEFFGKFTCPDTIMLRKKAWFNP